MCQFFVLLYPMSTSPNNFSIVPLNLFSYTCFRLDLKKFSLLYFIIKYDHSYLHFFFFIRICRVILVIIERNYSVFVIWNNPTPDKKKNSLIKIWMNKKEVGNLCKFDMFHQLHWKSFGVWWFSSIFQFLNSVKNINQSKSIIR